MRLRRDRRPLRQPVEVGEQVEDLVIEALGAVVLFQVGRYRMDYRYTGPISMVVGAARSGWATARHRRVPATVDVDRRGAFVVRLLHGTGAEIPTQAVLFVSAGARVRPAVRPWCSHAFVAGLVVTDLAECGDPSRHPRHIDRARGTLRRLFLESVG